MNRFNKNPLKNLHHVKAVEPPKTGRAARRERGELSPPASRREQNIEQETHAFLQSIAIDQGAGDRTGFFVIDSMAQMVSEEIERRLDPADTRENQDRRMSRLVNMMMIGTPDDPSREARAREVREQREFEELRDMARSAGAPEFVYRGIRMRTNEALFADQMVVVSGHHRAAAAQTLREQGRAEIRRQEYPDEMAYFPNTLLEAARRQQLEAARMATPTFTVDLESTRSAFESLGRAAEHMSASMQSVGRALRVPSEMLREARVSFGSRMRNYPIQAAAAEMMQMDFSEAERRVIAGQPASAGALGDALLSQEAISGFIDAILAPSPRMGFMQAMRKAEAKKKAELNKPPHPDAGKVINRPRRSVEGFMVEDVRNADGSITRRLRTKE